MKKFLIITALLIIGGVSVALSSNDTTDTAEACETSCKSKAECE